MELVRTSFLQFSKFRQIEKTATITDKNCEELQLQSSSLPVRWTGLWNTKEVGSHSQYTLKYLKTFRWIFVVEMIHTVAAIHRMTTQSLPESLMLTALVAVMVQGVKHLVDSLRATQPSTGLIVQLQPVTVLKSDIMACQKPLDLLFTTREVNSYASVSENEKLRAYEHSITKSS